MPSASIRKRSETIRITVPLTAADHNELVKERTMDENEKQMSMEFDDEEEINLVSDDSSPDAHPDDAHAEQEMEAVNA